MLLNELLTEASTPQRAWDGKLKKIDALLAWMYDKDILTKTEKAKKDTVFRAYYRYYNDGDIPKGISGVNRHTPEEEVAKALEIYLETFIKSILSKYLPRVDRTEFRIDKLVKDLSSVIGVSADHDAHGLLTYWLKTVKINDPESVLKQLVDTLKEQYAAVKNAADAADPKSENTVMSYRADQMKKAGKWNKSLEKAWNAAKGTMDEITEFLKNLQSSVKDLKKQKVLPEPTAAADD